MRAAICVVAVLLALASTACEEKVCAPGATQQCVCTDGRPGAQFCSRDGLGWGRCECTGSSLQPSTAVPQPPSAPAVPVAEVPPTAPSASSAPQVPSPSSPNVEEPVVEPPPSTAQTGTLHVNTMPWSQIYVDGRLVGNSPQRNIRVSPGTHRLTLVNEELNVRQSVTVTVQAGETVTKAIRLDTN